MREEGEGGGIGRAAAAPPRLRYVVRTDRVGAGNVAERRQYAADYARTLDAVASLHGLARIPGPHGTELEIGAEVDDASPAGFGEAPPGGLLGAYEELAHCVLAEFIAHDRKRPATVAAYRRARGEATARRRARRPLPVQLPLPFAVRPGPDPSDRAPRVATLPRLMTDAAYAARWLSKVADSTYLDLPRRDRRQHLEDVVDAYQFQAAFILQNQGTTLYRRISVPRDRPWREVVRLDRIGKAWSVEESGAGTYGVVPHPAGATREILLVGRVGVDAIDWAYGFLSFFYYGEDQWEISLKQYARVTLLEVDGERLAPPLAASTGSSWEVWAEERA